MPAPTPSTPTPESRRKKRGPRRTIRLDDLPRFPDATDKLPQPAEIEGRRKRWVGIGWVDEGPATGREPLLVLTDSKATPEEWGHVAALGATREAIDRILFPQASVQRQPVGSSTAGTGGRAAPGNGAAHGEAPGGRASPPGSTPLCTDCGGRGSRDLEAIDGEGRTVRYRQPCRSCRARGKAQVPTSVEDRVIEAARALLAEADAAGHGQLCPVPWRAVEALRAALFEVEVRRG